MNDVALELVELKRSFTQGDVTIEVLRGVNASLRRGEIVALLGPSGSGKSTMLQAVGLLEGGFGGTIRIDGEDVTRFEQGERTKTRREKIGFVYQFHHLLPDFNAIENVVLPQLIRGTAQQEAEERAADLLGRLGLGERLHHKPSKLSGGEQQRVAVARAGEPPLAGAGRRADGQPRRGDRRPGVRPVRQSGARSWLGGARRDA